MSMDDIASDIGQEPPASDNASIAAWPQGFDDHSVITVPTHAAETALHGPSPARIAIGLLVSGTLAVACAFAMQVVLVGVLGAFLVVSGFVLLLAYGGGVLIGFAIRDTSGNARLLASGAMPPGATRLRPPRHMPLISDQDLLLRARPNDLAGLVDAIADQLGAGPNRKGRDRDGRPTAAMRVGPMNGVWIVVMFTALSSARAGAILRWCGEGADEAIGDEAWFVLTLRCAAPTGKSLRVVEAAARASLSEMLIIYTRTHGRTCGCARGSATDAIMAIEWIGR